jgi:hypothetical protein
LISGSSQSDGSPFHATGRLRRLCNSHAERLLSWVLGVRYGSVAGHPFREPDVGYPSEAVGQR